MTRPPDSPSNRNPHDCPAFRNPSTYTQEAAEKILDGLWEGKFLRDICAPDDMPTRRTVSNWRKAHPAFDADYREAMEGGAHALIEETRAIVDNLKEEPQSRKVRAWQRFEEAERKAPRSKSVNVHHAGAVGTYDLSGLDDEELDRLESILGRLTVSRGSSGGEGEAGSGEESGTTGA